MKALLRITVLFRSFSVLALLGATAAQAALPIPSATPEMNAAIFLKEKYRGSGEGGSAGAGNGGGNLPRGDFFAEAFAGLEILKFMPEFTAEQIEQIRVAMYTTPVSPVEFQLCPQSDTVDCPNSAFAAKNYYPQYKHILLDTRQDPDRPWLWSNLSISDRREVALHEFAAAVPPFERDNHFFSQQINDRRIYNEFKAKRDIRMYFQQMNDTYAALPQAPAYLFAGDWVKVTILQPEKQLHSTDEEKLLGGDKFRIHIGLLRKQSGDPFPGMESHYYDFDRKSFNVPTEVRELKTKDPVSTVLEDYSHHARLEQPSGWEIFYGDCRYGTIQDGEFQCLKLDYRKDPLNGKLVLSEKWTKKMKSIFDPSLKSYQAKEGSPASSFSCKVYLETSLMCRHIFLKPDYFGFTKVYQYSFYERTREPLRDSIKALQEQLRTGPKVNRRVIRNQGL